MTETPEQVLEVIPGEFSEEQAWSYVKDRYASFLQGNKLAGKWTVAPRRKMGGWWIEVFRED